jgi:hypothetical protein
LIVDAEKYVYRVPADKRQRVAKVVDAILQKAITGKWLEVKDLQRLTGSLISWDLAAAQARLMTRGLYQLIARAGGSRLVPPDEEAVEDLRYWAHAVQGTIEYRIRPRPSEVKVFTDASAEAWGAVMYGTRVAGQLPQVSWSHSSTVRELMALAAAVKALGPQLESKSVCFCMDSAPAVRNMINGGSKHAHLTAHVKQVTVQLQELKTVAQFEWVPRELNGDADALSRLFGGRSEITREAAVQLESEFGQLHESLDVGDSKGDGRIRLINVAPGQISKALLVAEERRLIVVMLYPEWPAQSWWPFIRARASRTMRLQEPVFVSKQQRIGVVDRHWPVYASLISFQS